MKIKREINMGSHWHYEIRIEQENENDAYSSVWVVDHHGLPDKKIKVFHSWRDETHWLSERGF